MLKSRLLYVLGILCCTVSFTAVTTTPSAQASSVYDTYYSTVDSLFYGAVNYYGINCPMVDVSDNFLKVFGNEDFWAYSGEYDTFWSTYQDAVENGSWAVGIQQDYTATGHDANVYLVWNTNGGQINFVGSEVYAVGSGTVTAQLYMRQDLIGSGGCVPAIRAFSMSGSIISGDGGIGDANYLASGWTVNYPVGYEGPLVREQPPAATYVAMGDSFSSGEGNPPFEEGSDTSSDKCHRSPQAYPRLLEFDASLDLGATAFAACSGATTYNVLNGQNGEQAQVNALSVDTQVVTITIGGNDVGFKDFATACATSLCNFSTSAYTTIQNKIINDLPDKLADVYTAIDNATSSGTKVYVIGYPQIAPAEMPTGFGSGCWPLNGQQDDSDPTKNDGATAYAVVTQLNEAIQDAVTNYGSSKFEFIDPNVSGSPFEGHDWCEDDRYFDIITLNNLEYSFHPNHDGQVAYYQVVKGQI